MNRPMNLDEFQDLLAALQRPQALSEAAVLLSCLVLAGLLVWLMQLRRPKGAGGEDSVLFGRRVVDGALFPVIALALAFAARSLLKGYGVPAVWFKLALPVLVSLALIRVTVRVLTVAMPKARWVGSAERQISWLAWGATVVYITGLWPLLTDGLDEVQWKVGSVHMNLGDLLSGLLSAGALLVGALWLSSIIEARLMRSVADLSLRKIGVNLTRAMLLFIGLMVALKAANIDLTALSVLGGALGVGLGFGLQKLAANYVSGFVILAERSLRIGDMIKVDGFEGRVIDIKTRYTVVRSLDGRESIVPNEMLITQRVENSSLADPRVLLTTVVQVAYGTDLVAVMPRLQAAAATVPRVLKDPSPGVQLSQFAADGLELTVLFWIADPENGRGSVRSEVNLALLATLNEAGVEIPYPQRVVRQAG
ncbi:MAG TPA: mechanosensitive ion channel domain-containing protein [Burkholderiaceae bacterium]